MKTLPVLLLITGFCLSGHGFPWFKSQPEKPLEGTAEELYQEGLRRKEKAKPMKFILQLRKCDYNRLTEPFDRLGELHPYHPLAELSRLMRAEIYLQCGDPRLARLEIQDFVEKMGEDHPQAPKALEMYVNSYAGEINGPEYDLTPACATFATARNYLDHFKGNPIYSSEWRSSLEKSMTQALRVLAEGQLLRGDFYAAKNECEAAHRRYDQVLHQFNGFPDLVSQAEEKKANCSVDFPVAVEILRCHY